MRRRSAWWSVAALAVIAAVQGVLAARGEWNVGLLLLALLVAATAPWGQLRRR